MRHRTRMKWTLLILAMTLLPIASVWAEDLILTGTLQSQAYAVDGTITTGGDCQVTAGSSVNLEASTVILSPGFSASAGSNLVVSAQDPDGMSNTCEMDAFGNLNQMPDDDYDEDGLTNVQECEAGTDPYFPTDYISSGESLQAAITAASNGDTILVGPGTYQVSATISEKSIILKSLDGPETTILNRGSGSYIILTLSTPASNQSIIEGFTFSGANYSAIVIDASSPTIKNCIFNDNISYFYYGGACRIFDGSPLFDACTFRNNSSEYSNGGICSDQSNPTFTNCNFINNYAPAIRNVNGTYASFLNCSFFEVTWSNPDSRTRSVIYNDDSTANIVNTIIRLDHTGSAANEQPAVGNSGTGTATISYSNIEGSGGSNNWNSIFGTNGGGNLDVDPQFASTADLRLSLSSPCIDQGTASGAPATDIDGDARPINGMMDMGSDEYAYLPEIIYFTGPTNTIYSDDDAHITWNVEKAQTVRIDPAPGSVNTSGSIYLSPDVTTTYTLTATNFVGTLTRQITVNVREAVDIISFMANSSTVDACSATSLNWSTGGADIVTISPLVGEMPHDGSISVRPQSTTTYVLTASSVDRTEQSSVTVTVVNGTSDNDGDGLLNAQEDINNNGVVDDGETAACDEDSDNDGMQDGWEVQYGLNPLVGDGGLDVDGDLLTNLDEYILGLNPTVANRDNDSDGIEDWLEIEYAGYDLGILNSPDDDNDGDGVSNRVELLIGSDPTKYDHEGARIHYTYDKIGRIKTIRRVPAN